MSVVLPSTAPVAQDFVFNLLTAKFDEQHGVWAYKLPDMLRVYLRGWFAVDLVRGDAASAATVTKFRQCPPSAFAHVCVVRAFPMAVIYSAVRHRWVLSQPVSCVTTEGPAHRAHAAPDEAGSSCQGVQVCPQFRSRSQCFPASAPQYSVNRHSCHEGVEDGVLGWCCLLGGRIFSRWEHRLTASFRTVELVKLLSRVIIMAHWVSTGS